LKPGAFKRYGSRLETRRFQAMGRGFTPGAFKRYGSSGFTTAVEPRLDNGAVIDFIHREALKRDPEVSVAQHEARKAQYQALRYLAPFVGVVGCSRRAARVEGIARVSQGGCGRRRRRRGTNDLLLMLREGGCPPISLSLSLIPQAELREKLAKTYDVSDNACVSLFGFRTQFGGGKSTGFGLIAKGERHTNFFGGGER
jgi:hypothetical protein